MVTSIIEHQPEIAELCRSYGVYKLDLFGSATTEEFKPETSDFDFVVNFWDRSPGYARRFVQLADELEAILGREVDLITERSIQDPDFRRFVDQQRETVFEDRNREAAARLADSL
ncbi:MAG: nucleotidyltransferase domain-containing protein [Thermomicrobiales bacterium]|nr:nucleotidyltransferase domain-containing protein [Thermomicrobiales bacterium]